MSAADMRELTRSLQEVEQSFQQGADRVRQQSYQYSAPQSNSFYGSNGVVYNRVGSSIIGSNGVTYNQVGNSIIGSDGTACQIVGQSVLCR